MQVVNAIDFGTEKVLSTAHLAKTFGTTSNLLTRNFQRNKQWYEEGVHYFVLSGEDLKKYKETYELTEILKFVSIYYLWTMKGAWLHAKSLNTKESWRAYETLFHAYATEEGVENERNIMHSPRLHEGEKKRLRSAVSERVHQLARDEKDARPVLFRTIYRAICERYQVESYRDVRQHQLQDALQFIGNWGKVGE